MYFMFNLFVCDAFDRVSNTNRNYIAPKGKNDIGSLCWNGR